jgi:hypothetical protein
MAIDQARMAQIALRLIEENGRDTVFVKFNRTPDDPAAPWQGSSATPATAAEGDRQPARAAFVPPQGAFFGRSIGPFDPRRARSVDETSFERLDQVALIAAAGLPSTVDLETFDAVEDGGRAWRIVNVETLKPADIPLVYAVGLVG